MTTQLKCAVVSTVVLATVFVLSQASFAASHTVNINGIAFTPETLEIMEGDNVTWQNNTSLTHTSTSGNPDRCNANGIWNSGSLPPGGSFNFVFNSDGTFPYFCIPHCSAGMRGTIIVNQAVPVRKTTWGAIKALFALGGPSGGR